MRSRQSAFKRTQVFAWDSEPSNERPSEFSTSAFVPPYKQSGEFESSSFLDAAPHPPTRRRERRFVRLLVWAIATLCLVLFGVVGFGGLLA